MHQRTQRRQLTGIGSGSHSSTSTSSQSHADLFEFFQFFPKRYAPGKRETEEQRRVRKLETMYGVKNMSKNDDTDNPSLILSALQNFENQIRRTNRYGPLPDSFSLATQDLKNVSHFYFEQDVGGNIVIRLQVNTLLTQSWQTLQEVVFENNPTTKYVQVPGNTFDVTLKRLRFNHTNLDDKGHVPIFRFTCFYQNVEYISPNYFLIRTGGQRTLAIVQNYRKNFDKAVATPAPTFTAHITQPDVVMLPKHRSETSDSNQPRNVGYKKVDIAPLTFTNSPITPSSTPATPVSNTSSPSNSEAEADAHFSEEESEEDESMEEGSLSPLSMPLLSPQSFTQFQFTVPQTFQCPIAQQYQQNQHLAPPFLYD